jgi:hypothetical protein
LICGKRGGGRAEEKILKKKMKKKEPGRVREGWEGAGEA